MVKNLSAMQETHFLTLGREDSLRKETQPTPVLLPGKLHGQRRAWRATVHGVTRVRHNLVTKPSHHHDNLMREFRHECKVIGRIFLKTEKPSISTWTIAPVTGMLCPCVKTASQQVREHSEALDCHHLAITTCLGHILDVRVGLWRKLSTKESMLLNCGVGEDSWESLGVQGDPTSPS